MVLIFLPLRLRPTLVQGVFALAIPLCGIGSLSLSSQLLQQHLPRDFWRHIFLIWLSLHRGLHTRLSADVFGPNLGFLLLDTELFGAPLSLASAGDIGAIEVQAWFDLIPRTVQHQKHRFNTPASTPKEYTGAWMTEYLALIDHLTSQLKQLSYNPMPRLKAQFLLPSFKASPPFRWTLESDILLATDASTSGLQTLNLKYGSTNCKQRGDRRSVHPSWTLYNPCFQMFTSFSKFCWPCPFQQLPPNAVSAPSVGWRPTFKGSTATETRLSSLVLTAMHLPWLPN